MMNSEKCLICEKTNFKNSNSFTKHLRKHKISSKDYYLFYIDYTAGICEVCNKEVKFSNIDKGFPKLCRKCNNKNNPKRIQKIKETNLRKYGVENASQVDQFKEKRKKTNLKRYGVEHAMSNPEIQKRCSDTWSKKYKEGHPGRSKSVKEKKKNTCQIRYGVDNPSQVEEFQEKKKHTNLNIFGTTHPLKNKVFYKKFEDKMVSLYGKPKALQVPEFLEKARQTNQKNRGTDWPMQAPEVVEKISGSNSYRWINDREQRFAPYTKQFFNEDFREQIRIEQNELDPVTGEPLEMSAHLHHIDYNKQNDLRNNLIFLNKSTHHKTNTNRNHWQNLLTKINEIYI